MTNKIYPSDLDDAQWKMIAPMIPEQKDGGRPRTVDMRCVTNAILYMVRGGCSWRMLPKEYGPWETAYGYFRTIRRDGVWQRIHDMLREKIRRNAENATPSSTVINSQTVKTGEKLITCKLNIEYSVCYVQILLKRWGLTPQKPKRIAYEQNPEAVERWLTDEYPEIKKRAKAEKASIYWGDETGIRSDDQLDRSYARRGGRGFRQWVAHVSKKHSHRKTNSLTVRKPSVAVGDRSTNICG